MKKITPQFFSIAGLFFFWGFVAASNDVLIPIFKDHLQLEQWQSQMISFVFYVAYTIGSILYLWICQILKADLLEKMGYTKGLSIGLLISFIGVLFFIPASLYSSFLALIIGLLIIGLGFSLQQTAANPLVIKSGDESFGSQRLSLAGGINNIGTTIGPLLVSYAVFGQSKDIESLNNLMYPYLFLGLLFIVFTIYFQMIKINFSNDSKISVVTNLQNIKDVIIQKDVWMAMLAIFTYVGVEVSTAANLAEFAKQKANVSTSEIAPFISLYWACLMIGRWASAADVFANRKFIKIFFKILFPLLAFGLFMIILNLNNKSIPHLEWMFGFIALLIVADFISEGNANKQLILYAALGLIMITIGMASNGLTAVLFMVSVGLFCSTLWPCIFEIALKGKKHNSGLISSLLIMMIMGGGWISILQAYLSKFVGINASYSVGVCCFVYLMIYGIQSMRKLDNAN
ncbi:MAG: hypothetical protein KatS3mg027_0597 [Bacteroidia bacterium]|nr:MAG: hypothetical protein KatS3mg027_0597 [Bacteroidia bacterium]